jgi:holo-[acyl-carrier protein] synthase
VSIDLERLAIAGIGVDIISVARIAQAVGSDRFVQRVFTEAEQAYCARGAYPAQHYAGRFAAKEAVIKCLRRKTPWREIEILRLESGAPVVKLHGRAAELADGREVLVTISHTGEYSVAHAVLLEGRAR